MDKVRPGGIDLPWRMPWPAVSWQLHGPRVPHAFRPTTFPPDGLPVSSAGPPSQPAPGPAQRHRVWPNGAKRDLKHMSSGLYSTNAIFLAYVSRGSPHCIALRALPPRNTSTNPEAPPPTPKRGASSHVRPPRSSGRTPTGGRSQSCHPRLIRAASVPRASTPPPAAGPAVPVCRAPPASPRDAAIHFRAFITLIL